MRSAYCFDPVIIRENDVRGVYGETLTTDDAYALGRAYATAAGNGRRIAVGYEADLILWDMTTPDQIAYEFDNNISRTVLAAGEPIFSGAPGGQGKKA